MSWTILRAGVGGTAGRSAEWSCTAVRTPRRNGTVRATARSSSGQWGQRAARGLPLSRSRTANAAVGSSFVVVPCGKAVLTWRPRVQPVPRSGGSTGDGGQQQPVAACCTTWRKINVGPGDRVRGKNAVTMIDLDKPTEDRPERGSALRFGWYQVVRALGLLAVGGAVGGLATYKWQAQLRQVAQESVISVLIFPGTISWSGGSTSAIPWGGETVHVVELQGQVAIVNAGPSPINTQNLAVDQDEFTLRSSENGGWIKPGQAVTVGVSMKVSCTSSGVLQRIQASILVETMHDHSPESASSITFDGSPWSTELERACTDVRD